MKVYFYSKLDRGYYESAYAIWRQQGGRFLDHLEHQQSMMTAWKREFDLRGYPMFVDVRSSFLVPQTLRSHLPLSLARIVRAVLWASWIDRWLLHRDLILKFKTNKPDIVFIGMGSAVWESTLRELKQCGARLVQWVGLPAATMLPRDRKNLPYFDLILIPANLEAGLRRAGAKGKIAYVPQAIDPERYYPMTLTREECARYEANVCFIGGLDTQFHQERRAWIEYAIEQGVSMKIWGGYRQHFINSPILRIWQGQVWGDEQVKALCGAKIGLNLHVNHEAGELDRGLNLRSFELAACGVFQLLRYVPGVHEFFDVGKEIICFESKEDMVDKIRYYLDHDAERQQIANAARQRVLREHTWRKRLDMLLPHLEALSASIKI